MKQKDYWQELWNKLGGVHGLAEIYHGLRTGKKIKPTGKKIVWKRWGEK